MLELIANLLPIKLKIYLRNIQDNNRYKTWEKDGKPNPPPHIVKQSLIKHYQSKYNIQCFVETGTYLGDMVFAMVTLFKNIYSVELSQSLWKIAVKRFKNNSNVHILQGDSAIMLSKIVDKLDTATIFWLDGHYSAGMTAKGIKDCPIIEELNTIFISKLEHIILIDDAHMFNGLNDYPSINELENYVKSKKNNYFLHLKDNIIVLHDSDVYNID